jgi:amino acid adenylation domain-containing protein
VEAGWLSQERRELLQRLRTQRGMVAGHPGIQPRGDGGGPIPLSPGQSRLWFLDRIQPGTPRYNVSGAAWLRGPLDIAALRAAVAALTKRHEVLRTVMRAGPDGVPSLEIQAPADVPVPVIPVRHGQGSFDAEQEALATARRICNEPFDLSAGPLLRCRLLRLRADLHLFVLVIHHIVFDGWSLPIVIGELSEAYQAAVAGRPASLPPLGIQYADFALWQREWLATAEAAQQLAYWRERLAGAPMLSLPIGRSRPAHPSLAGAVVQFRLPAPDAERLQHLAHQEGTTPFVVGLAGFAAVLSRWAHQDDLTIGTPVSGRHRPELVPLVGFFVNTLPIRLGVTGGEPLTLLVRHTHEALMAAQAHGDIPFDHIVEHVQPARDAGGRTPLLRHLFQAEESIQPISLGDVEFEPVAVDIGVAKFDLTMRLSWEAHGGLIGSLEYDTELFQREMAARLVRGLQQTYALPSWSTPVSGLPLVTPAERAVLLGRHSGAATGPVPVPAPAPALHQLFEDQADAAPDAVAVQAADGELSYGELDARANRLARLLRARGAGTDQVAGVCLWPGIERVVAILAVLKAGAAFLPLDPAYPQARLEYLVDDAGAGIMVTDTTQVCTAPPARAGMSVVCLRRDQESIAAQDPQRIALPVTGNQLAYVIYTSGSTGSPKGAMNEHRAVVNRLLWMQQAFGLTPGEGVLHKTAIGFDVSVWEYLWPLVTGARCVVCKPGGHLDPRYLAGLITQAQVTTVHFVPAMLRSFLADPAAGRCGTSLRRIVCSGEELPAHVAAACRRLFPGTELFNLYGPAETAIDVTWHRYTGDEDKVSIGRPIDGAHIYIVDAAGEPVPAGVPGELLIGGLPVGRGYWRRRALTASRFIPDPFGPPGGRLYRTGDLACWRADGAIDFLGRIDRQVSLRGARIEPVEVESALASHPGVQSAVVTVRPGRDGSPALVAYVLLTGAGDDDGLAPRLRSYLRERIPAHMIPSAFVPVSHWPLSPNGKLSVADLPMPPDGPALHYVAPASDIERQIAALWAESLGVPRVGVADDFFDLGGHSLLASQLVARMTAAFGVELTVAGLFDSPTVTGTARAIATAHQRRSGPGLRRLDRSRYRSGRSDEADVSTTDQAAGPSHQAGAGDAGRTEE